MCRVNIDCTFELEREQRSLQVVRLQPSQADGLAGVLSRAFFDEPNFRYMMPDEQERFRLLPGFFRVALRTSSLFGETYTTPSLDGGALWIGPEHAFAPWRMARTGCLSMPLYFGRRNLRRCITLGARLEKIRGRLAPGSHWYLMALGVEPSEKGRGIAGRLIEPVLWRADSDRLPCYLETFSEKSLPFYGRHGFRIAAAGKIPGGPAFWVLIRSARSPLEGRS